MADNTPDEIVRKYIISYARKNLWRFVSRMDFEDLVQEGHMSYYATRKRYPSVTDPAHVMSLFKLVHNSRMTDISRKIAKQGVIVGGSAYIEHVQDHYGPESRCWARLQVFFGEDAQDVVLLIMQAPERVRKAIQALLSPDGKVAGEAAQIRVVRNYFKLGESNV